MRDSEPFISEAMTNQCTHEKEEPMLWYQVFLSADARMEDHDVVVRWREPTEREEEDASQAIGYYYAGFYTSEEVNSAQEALDRALEEFDGWGGCVA